MIQGFHGDIGVYVHDLKHNKIVAINADTIFPTASIVKVSILIGIMDKIQSGELNYHQRFIYTTLYIMMKAMIYFQDLKTAAQLN